MTGIRRVSVSQVMDFGFVKQQQQHSADKLVGVRWSKVATYRPNSDLVNEARNKFVKNLYISHTQRIECRFKVYKCVHHHTIQINQPTRCNSFSSLLLGVYLQLNMFRASSRPSSGATTTAVAASGFTVGAWW